MTVPEARWRQARCLVLGAALAACSQPATGVDRRFQPPPPRQSCTLTNPLGSGADPWVVREGSWYYLAQSRDNAIWISRSRKLSDIVAQQPVRVWTAPDTGWNRTNVWAPELHRIGGRWYIYYAAGRSGPPFIEQRAGVLEALTDDAQGAYSDRGMLYTGDSVATGRGVRWAIDLTVGEIAGKLYAVWSGWEQNAATDRTPQQLYIAEMTNPWTIGTNRVRISAPTESWERGTELDLEEGPEFLRHGTRTFIIYSTRESWLRDYRLGELELVGSDPMSASSYVKSGPVFTGTAAVYGVGHASFTVSPDSTESWIVYHSKADTIPGWQRVIRMQKFTWSASGAPVFGTPVPPGEAIPVPSGECM